MKKVLSMLGIVAIITSVLTGCGSKKESTNTPTAEPTIQVEEETKTDDITSEPSKEEEQVAGTRTISTVKGDVIVPANPNRVIIHYLMGDVSALGITPVGTSSVLAGAAFEEDMKDALDLGSWDFDPEAVMSLEPDLIITVNEAQYEDLSKIAPTVYVPYGEMNTKERVTFLADILNKQEEAKNILSEYDEKIKQGRIKLNEAGVGSATVTILQATEATNSVAGSKHALGVLAYNELGLLAPEKVQKDIIDADEYWAQPSLELIPEYVGDYMIHLGEVLESLSNNNVWNSIPAVKNGNILEVKTAYTYYTDIVSSNALIDTLVEGLTELSNSN